MRRRAASLIAATSLGLAVLAPAAAAGAGAGPRQLVFMQQVRPVTITWQNVAVQDDGEASVIVVIGETTIPRPVRFRLDAAALARLRSLVARSRIDRMHITAAIPFSAMMYTLRADGDAVRVVQGHLPPTLRPLIAFLHALIVRHP